MQSLHSPRYRAFVARLVLARTRARYTQVEAAALLGIPQSRLSRMETGERRVDVIELLAFAKLYRRRLAWFVEG